MNKLHYDYSAKKDLLSVYYVQNDVPHLLGSISIKNTSEETKAAFMADMVKAKEAAVPSEAPWHANNIFDENGNLNALSIRKYGSKPQWFLKRGDKVKTEVVKSHELNAQVEYYARQICFQHAVPENVVTEAVVRHAIQSLYRNVVLNNN